MSSLMEHLKQVIQGTKKQNVNNAEVEIIRKSVGRWSGRLMNTVVNYGLSAQDLYIQGIADGMEVARRWDREPIEIADILTEADRIVRREVEGE